MEVVTVESNAQVTVRDLRTVDDLVDEHSMAAEYDAVRRGSRVARDRAHG